MSDPPQAGSSATANTTSSPVHLGVRKRVDSMQSLSDGDDAAFSSKKQRTYIGSEPDDDPSEEEIPSASTRLTLGTLYYRVYDDPRNDWMLAQPEDDDPPVPDSPTTSSASRALLTLHRRVEDDPSIELRTGSPTPGPLRALQHLEDQGATHDLLPTFSGPRPLRTLYHREEDDPSHEPVTAPSTPREPAVERVAAPSTPQPLRTLDHRVEYDTTSHSMPTRSTPQPPISVAVNGSRTLHSLSTWSTPQTPSRSLYSLGQELMPPLTPRRFSTRILDRFHLSDRALAKCATPDSYDEYERRARRNRINARLVDPISEASASHWLKNTSVTFAYSLPPVKARSVPARLFTCSGKNVLYFTRGDRVYYTKLSGNGPSATEPVQLCKLKSSEEGHIVGLSATTRYLDDPVAVGTSKGQIQLWDIETKKMEASWKTLPSIRTMICAGRFLAVGSKNGQIRIHDIRDPQSGLGCRRIYRHEAPVTSICWSPDDDDHLVSGDENGTVLYWDTRQPSTPLNIGEPDKRHKKMVHSSSISAIAWNPWRSEFVSADVGGVVKIWDLKRSGPTNLADPGPIETNARITSMHFSRRCRELLITHGAEVSDSASSPPEASTSTSSSTASGPSRERVANAISVVAFPTFKSRKIVRLEADPEMAIGDGVLDASGTRLIYTTPANGKINIAEVWQRKPVVEVKRAKSMLDINNHDLLFAGIR